tara:strand:- start:460 stop:1395 length:936 start_codon:yes stop_codon:yes gene_type:complete
MCDLIQYSRESIIKFIENGKSNSELIKKIINQDFLKKIKIIEINFTDNTPTFNTYKKKDNYSKKKKYFKIKPSLPLPSKRPVTFLSETKSKEEELKKNINSNLNKLSPQNFKKIWENIKVLYLNDKELFDINSFINTIFEKATMQFIYCPLYVNMINLMIELLNEDNRGGIIKELVINKCIQFKNMIDEINKTDDDVLNVNDYDDFCKKTSEKIYKKGFSQFIGELYRSNFLEQDFLEEYIYILVENTLNTLNNDDNNIENNILCLQKLIETCYNYRELKNKKFFNNIKLIKEHKILPKKIKFRLMDMLRC